MVWSQSRDLSDSNNCWNSFREKIFCYEIFCSKRSDLLTCGSCVFGLDVSRTNRKESRTVQQTGTKFERCFKLLAFKMFCFS